MKTCRKCGLDKDVDQFVRDKQRKDGRYPYCKACHRANVQRERVEQTDAVRQRDRLARARRDANAQARERYLLGNWIYSLARRYGITAADYIQMAEAQDNRCAICGSSPDPSSPRTRSLHVDHDHSTGDVRGLLCFKCNTALGLLEDNVDRMLAAIEYLDKGRAGQNYTP